MKLQLAATHCPRSIILVTWQHYVSWNLPRIMWNSGISREMDYILPNLTYLVSIQPNVIILYTFRVSLDFWSLESGDPEILESPGFGKFQHVGYFSQSVCVKDFDFQCRIRKVHHSRNLRGIIWNSGISLEMVSFLYKIKV